MKIGIIVATVLLIMMGCTSDNCPVGQTKCQDNQIWICNKSADWNKLDDCAEISALNGGISLACVPPGADGPAACLPVSVDAGAGGSGGIDSGSADSNDEADATMSDEELMCLVLNICEQKDAKAE